YFIVLSSLFIYSVFVVSNTMFSSRKDMEGALALLIFLIFVMTIIFVAGKGEWVITLVESVVDNTTFQQYTNRIILLLLIPVSINLFLAGLFNLKKRKVG